MQLYQTRDFNSFFQDTFTFLKQNGKHFFTNFFSISGALILILGLISYYVSKTYTEALIYNFTINFILWNPSASNHFFTSFDVKLKLTSGLKASNQP